jgi:hypothetical protein
LTAPSMKELAVSSQSGSSWKRDGKSYRCSGSTLSDLLMAERIRSILFEQHRANRVQVSLRLDANSFWSGSGSVPPSSWSSNVWIYILCAVALCGTVFAAGFTKQSSSPSLRTPHRVMMQLVSKWTANAKTAVVAHSHSHSDSVDADRGRVDTKHDGGGGAHRELTVNTSSPTPSSNSAEQFLLKTFESLGTPSFVTTKLIQSLRDDHCLTSIERLRHFDDADWRRHGLRQSHIAVVRTKLMDGDHFDDDTATTNRKGHGHHHDDDDDHHHDHDHHDDDLSFDDDDNGWNGNGNAAANTKHSENNESTTDFDDF